MIRVARVLCGVCCLAAVSVQAQTTTPAPTPSPAAAQSAAATGAVRGARAAADPVAVVERDAAGAITAVRATRVRESIVLDGKLDEDVYARVAAVDGFVQQEPAQGQPGTERTQVWLLYDERNIYVSGRMFDSDPAREIITEMRRDGQGTNDNESFGVVFDTFHDRRNGFLFQVSLAGGLFDGYITDERDMSRDWSTVWNARTARTSDGWTVEMAIPFKSLRYPPGGEQTWGVNFKRVVRWKNETQHLTEIPAVLGRRGMNRLSAGATLVGLQAPNIHRVFELKPYGISGFTTEAPAGSVSNSSGKGDGGFDVKVGVTKGLTADVTYNTDFAQVELDEQQVNLTRFSIQFPEKRDFFLEGQGIFSFGGVAPGPRGGGNSFGNPQANDVPVMFFSRNIGLDNGRPTPIDVGARMTGKAGKYSIGLLNIRSADVESRNLLGTNFGVVRVKRDILRRSAIGMVYTDRSNASVGTGASRLVGVDGIFSFGQNLSINSYFAVSENPGLSGRNTSHRLQVDYNADKYGVQVERVALDENFRPDVGFTRRTAFTRNSAYLRYSPRPNRPVLRKWYVDAGYDHITDPFGRLQSSQAQAAFRAEFQNGDSWAVEAANLYEFLPAPFRIATNVTLPVGGYAFNEVRLNYNFGPQRPLSGQIQFELGEFYGGRRTTLSASRGRVQVNPQLMLEPGITLNAVTTPFGDFTSTLLSTRTTFTMTPRQGVSALFQYNSANNSLSTNIRYRWEYIPGSDFFVVLTDNRDTLPRGFPELRDRALIVKLTRLLRF